MRFWFVLIALSLLLSGCGGRKAIVVVGGRAVNYNDYWQTMERYYGDDSLRWLIQHQLLLKANEEQKLVSDQEVEREYRNFLRQSGFEEEPQFLAFLARQGMTKEALLAQIKHSLILMRLIEQQTKVDDKTLEEFYQRNWVLFARPPTGEPPTVRYYLFRSPNRDALVKVKALIDKGEKIGDVAYDFYKDDPDMRSRRGEKIIALPLVADPHTPLPEPPTLLKILAQDAPINRLYGPAFIPEAKYWVLVKVIERRSPFVLPFEKIKDFVKTAYAQQFGPPPEQIFQQLAQKYGVVVRDPRYKFLEDEIRTRALLASPPAFQPPAEAPSLTRPPSQEGGRLEQREQSSE